MTRPRTAVTSLYASWRVSSSFLRADRYSPSAPKGSAAWFFCSGVRVLRTPIQVNDTRTAAVVSRSHWAGDTAGRDSVRSNRVMGMVVLSDGAIEDWEG